METMPSHLERAPDREAAIETALRLIQQTSAAFVGTVSAISMATRGDIARRSAYVNKTVSSFNVLSIIASLLCLAAVAAIFAYVQRAVITRLKLLQQYMRAQVEGRCRGKVAFAPRGIFGLQHADRRLKRLFLLEGEQGVSGIVRVQHRAEAQEGHRSSSASGPRGR